MVYGKCAKGLHPLNRSKLSKKHKIRRMKFKKLYEDNKWWDDWKSQLHWNNIEWVNPKTLIERDKTYSVS